MNNDKQCAFSKAIDEYLATHPVKGIADSREFWQYAAKPTANGGVDATVQPCHKARRVRFWGALEHLQVMRGWGLDVDEFDPDAAARSAYPDVIFCHLQPNYSQGDVEQILDAVRNGTHFVTLQATDLWSDALAKRLGHTYKGVLSASAKDALYFGNCPKLFEGFPEGRLDPTAIPFMRDHACAVYLTGDNCMLGLANTGSKSIATAVAQYRYGKGAVTLVCPYSGIGIGEINEPAYKRFLLNLITLLPPASAKSR